VNIAVFCADLAHLVERDLAKVEVAGSSPVIRSNGFIPALEKICTARMHLQLKSR